MTTQTLPRVAIVDDHPLIAAGLQSSLTQSGIDAYWLEPSADDALSSLITDVPDLVLLDLDLGAERGDDWIEPISDAGLDVILITGSTDRTRIAQCLREGARGVLSKSLALGELAHRVLDALDGQSVNGAVELSELHAIVAEPTLSPADQLLTQREQAVLQALVDGKSPAEIADELCVSLATIRSHVRSILSKLGVSSQVAAVSAAVRAGWRPSTN